MHIVTRKSEVKEYIDEVISVYHLKGLSASVKALHLQILKKKVKFPLLEFCAHELFREIEEKEQIKFCDEVEKLKTEGGNVILGILLQNRLPNHFNLSIDKATEYIAQANIWYVCDIIGERVYGYALLHHTDKTIPKIKSLSKHTTNWVVRSLGAGVHYAVKKGLGKKEVERLFPILLSMANQKDKEIKQGVGWAGKTIAKFHPDLIQKFDKEILNKDKVANWFRRKIDVGLKRNEYAKRN